MALQVCRDCTTAYSVGAAACPQCGSARWVEEGTDMAKITERGPSDKTTYVDEPAPPLDEELGAEVAAEEIDDEAVPEATVDEVLAWTELDPSPPARLNLALEMESAKDTPRVTLVAELERRLAHY